MSEHHETLPTFLRNVISYVISQQSICDKHYIWNNHQSNISNILYDQWCIGFSHDNLGISREIQGKGMLHRCGACHLVITRQEKKILNIFVKSPEYLLAEVIEAYHELNTLTDGKMFCKITTKLVSKDFYDIKLQTAQLFGYEGLDECCVCSELTTTKTECRHPLCLECWGKLKKTNCPMCREEISCANIQCPYCNDGDDDE